MAEQERVFWREAYSESEARIIDAQDQAEAQVAAEQEELDYLAGIRSGVSSDTVLCSGASSAAGSSVPVRAPSEPVPAAGDRTAAQQRQYQLDHAIQALTSMLQRVQEGVLSPEAFAEQAFIIASFVAGQVPYLGGERDEQRGAR